jgi:hypothetical protein
MSNRAIFAIMGLVAVGAVVALWLLVRADDAPQQTASTTGSGSAAPRTGFAGPQHGPAGGKPLAPGIDPAQTPPNREYSSNGVIVHDHRTGTHEPYQPSEAPRPENGGRRLEPTLTKAIADRVRDVMHDCVKTLPDGTRGEKPRLEGAINVAIKAKQVLINKADLNVRDVSSDAAEVVRQCIVSKSMSIVQPAGDEADLDSYDINLSFNLI